MKFFNVVGALIGIVAFSWVLVMFIIMVGVPAHTCEIHMNQCFCRGDTLYGADNYETFTLLSMCENYKHSHH